MGEVDGDAARDGGVDREAARDGAHRQAGEGRDGQVRCLRRATLHRYAGEDN